VRQHRQRSDASFESSDVSLRDRQVLPSSKSWFTVSLRSSVPSIGCKKRKLSVSIATRRLPIRAASMAAPIARRLQLDTRMKLEH